MTLGLLFRPEGLTSVIDLGPEADRPEVWNPDLPVGWSGWTTLMLPKLRPVFTAFSGMFSVQPSVTELCPGSFP